MGSKMLKRFLLSALSLCLAWSQVYVARVYAQEGTTVTGAQLVINNYEGLTTTEKLILVDSSIQSPTYTYKAPTTTEGIVEVDTDNLTVTVKDYEDDYENVWKPVKVTVVEDGYDDVVIDLNGSYTTAIEPNGDKYSVKVTYETYVNYDTAEQTLLLNTPYYLATGVDSMNVLLGMRTDFINIKTTYVNALKLLVNGIPVFGDSTISLDPSDPDFDGAETVAAINDLDSQITNNVSGYLNITDELNAFADSGLLAHQYLAKSGASKLKEEAFSLYDNLYTIVHSTAIANLVSRAETVVNLGFPGVDVEAVKADLKTLNDFRAALEVMTNNLAKGTVEEKWQAVTKGVTLNDTDTPEDLAALLDVEEVSTHTAPTTSTYVLASTELEASVNRYQVNVTIQANVIEPNDMDNEVVTSGKKYTFTVTLDEGATEDDIKAQIDANNENITQFIDINWYAYDINDDNYDSKATGYTGPLSGNIDYVVTYSPKELTISGNTDLNGTVLYGHNLTLPVHSDPLKRYDYTVDGNAMTEGTPYRVVGDTTINRTEGKFAVESGLFAQILLDSNIVFGDEEAQKLAKLVLGSSATASEDKTLNYPVLEQTDIDNLGLITVTGDGETYTITADSYETGIADDMVWTPIAYSVDGGKYVEFDGTDTIEGAVNSVTVKYQLTVTRKTSADTASEFTTDFLNALNLTNELLELTGKQVTLLDTLWANKSDLARGSEIAAGIDMFIGNIYSSNRPEEEKAELIAYATNMKQGGFDTEGNLLLYTYLLSYGQNGLSSFYQPGVYENYAKQIKLLADNLGPVAATDEFKALLKNPGGLSDTQIDGLLGMVETIEKLGDEIGSIAPSDKINIKDSSSTTLINALKVAAQNNVEVNTFDSTAKLTHVVELTKAADGKVIMPVYVVFGGTIYNAGTITKEVGHLLTENDIQEMKDLMAAKATELGANADFYTATEFLPEAGTVVSKELTASTSWAIKEFVVEVEGMDEQKVTVNNKSFILPKSPNPAVKYVYTFTVNGKQETVDTEYAAGIYEFASNEDMLKAFENGSLVISVEVVDLATQKLQAYVSALNAGIDGNSKFVLTQDPTTGNYAIVLRIDAAELETVMDTLMGVVQGVATGSYGYVAVGDVSYDYVLWGEDTQGEVAGKRLSIQALINAILLSNFDMEVLMGAINEDGSTIENLKDLVDDVVVVGNTSTSSLGAVLVDSLMFLGNDEASATQYPFYITLDGKSDTLATVDSLLNKIDPALDLNTDDDRLQVVSEHEKVYQVLLAGMLLTGYADVKDITDIDYKALVEYIEEQLGVVFGDSVNGETIVNTAALLDVDLSEYTDLLNTLYSALDTLSFTDKKIDEVNNVYEVTANADISGLIEKMDLGEVATMLRETTIALPLTVKVDHFEESYEAFVFDNSKEGLNKVFFTNDLEGVMPTLGENAIVVLTGTVEAETLTTTNAVIVDLNGQTVTANIVNNGAGTTKIFASSFDGASVDGSLTGNFTIVGGTWTDDVTSYLPEGYEHGTDGVQSSLYTMTRDGSGNITVVINSDAAVPVKEIIDSAETKNALVYLGVDLALHLGMNFYTASSLSVDGNELYAINIEDLTAVLSATGSELVNDIVLGTEDGIVKYDGLNGFVNAVIADLVDFAALETAVAAGNAVATYELTTTPWSIELKHVTDGNYLTVGLVGNENVTDTETLVIKFSDDDADNLSKVLGVLADTTTVTPFDTDYVTLNSVQYVDGLEVDFEAGAKAVVDLTSDPKYTTLVAAILYNGTTGETKTALKEAIEAYVNDGDTTKLIDVLDNVVTIADIISSVKAARNKTFAQLTSGLSLDNDELVANASELEKLLREYVNVIGYAVEKLGVTGNSTHLNTVGSNGEYSYTKENWKGVVSGTLEVKLVAENEVSDLLIVPHVNLSTDTVYGYEIVNDTENEIYEIILDLRKEGLSASDFGDADTFDVWFDGNADSYVVDASNAENANTQAVYNGSVVKVTAIKNGKEVETREYTIKILGDVYADGRINNSDNYAIYMHFLGNEVLAEGSVQLWAADINMDGRINNTDSYLNSNKFLSGLTYYTSALTNYITKEGEEKTR